jgi:hypothetical protein
MQRSDVGLGAAQHTLACPKNTHDADGEAALVVWRALGAVSVASILVQPPTGRTMSSSSQ